MTVSEVKFVTAYEVINIITAFGQKPNSAVAEAIADRYPLKTTLIGDCQKVAKAGNAIREGFYAAMALQ